MIKIAFCSYFWKDSDEARKVLCRQVPNNSYSWGDITAVTEKDNPDFYVIFQNDTEFTNTLPPEKKIYLQREPEEIQSTADFKETSGGYKQTLEDSFQFTKWWVDATYDELLELKPQEKSENINVILSHKRDLKGHRLRSDFVVDFLDLYPNQIDLYGSLSLTYPTLKFIRRYPLLETFYNQWLKLPFSSTFIDFDKLEISLPYKYSLVAENSQQKNYFTEKIVDAYLSWNMPVYWGCPNIGDFFPEDSYYTIDINDNSAYDYLNEIAHRPLSQKNIEAIAEARKRILNKYNIWPALDGYIRDRIL